MTIKTNHVKHALTGFHHIERNYGMRWPNHGWQGLAGWLRRTINGVSFEDKICDFGDWNNPVGG